MQKNSLILLSGLMLLICPVAVAQTNVYHSFPDSNAVWRIDFQDHSNPWNTVYYSYQYYVDGDSTLSDSSKWIKLLVSGYPPSSTSFINSQLAYLIKNDSQNQIVYYKNCGGCDSILFNFSVQANDTIKNWYGLYSGDFAIVSSVDSCFIYPSYRRRINTPQFYLIDGIGSSKGIFVGLASFESNSELVCMALNDTTVFPHLNDPCTLVNSIENSKRIVPCVSIYPNPVEEQLTIDCQNLVRTNLKRFILYDILGRILIEQQITERITSINMTDITPGVFVLMLENSNHDIFFKKLIKK